MLPHSASTAPPIASQACRLPVVTAGKFFRCDGEKMVLRGISYGPFRPNSRGESFPEDDQLAADLTHIYQLGFNTLRIYGEPSACLLRKVGELGLRLIVGIAWTDHVDFMRSRARRQQILETVRAVTTRLHDQPSVIAFLVGNEIEKTLVRWMGPRRVQRFMEQLIDAGRACAPNKLFSYATYPSTEYLIPRNADFLAVNVYLERREDFAAYLQRLHHLAGNKPLVITEFGLDLAVHGEVKQAETFYWFEEECRRAAIAGTVWFSYTDEWFRGGEEITKWRFGIVDAGRSFRFSVLGSPLPNRVQRIENCKFISVIVCTYNGSATLRACLESLRKLSYPDFEVLVIDDGSTEDIAAITAAFPEVRYLRQEHAGLSAARNLGAREALGEILAYTDDDCLVDEDWLTHLAAGFDNPKWVACGGPNIPPVPRNEIEAIVAAAPGAPAHVMLNDAEAEHLPGCNLAIRKDALNAIGGFRDHYRTAGDDVDICWRLRDAGKHLRFMPGAMVWHHRRRTFGAYLRQQRGYGYAEALLMKDHPQHFGPIGGARWRGAIYGDASPTRDLAEGSIFYGPLGMGLFQGIYQHSRRCTLDWFSGVLWIAIFVVAVLLGWWWVAGSILGFSLLASLCLCGSLPPTPHRLSWIHRLQLLALCWLHPIVREGARLHGMITLDARPSWHPTLKEVFEPPVQRKMSLPIGEWAFWSEVGIGREAFLQYVTEVLKESGHETIQDAGWLRHDLETQPSLYLSTVLLTVTEYHGGQKMLTRVRCLMRLRWWAFLILVGLISISFLALPFEFWTGDWEGVLKMLFFPALIYILRHTMKRRVFKAAERCGMKELDYL